MKTISLIYLFLVSSGFVFGQLPDSADMRISYFGIPSQAPDPDFVKTQIGRLNARDTYLNTQLTAGGTIDTVARDSIQLLQDEKVAVADTSAMLAPYVNIADDSGSIYITPYLLDVAVAAIAEENHHAFLFFEDSTISLNYTTDWAHLTNAADSAFIQFELDGFTVTNDTITINNAGDYSLSGTFTHDGDNLETVSIRVYNVTQTEAIPVQGSQTTRAANNFGTTSFIAYADITAGDKVVIQYKGDASGTAVFKNAGVLILRIHE